MLSLKIIAPSLFLSVLTLSPASAMPVSPQPDQGPSIEAPVIQVQRRMDDDDWRRRRDRDDRWRRDDDWRRRYTPGRRYGDAPRGWRRYGVRPRDWRTRGCILVGPIWFCP